MEWPPKAATWAPKQVSGYLGHKTRCGHGVTEPERVRLPGPAWERPLIARYTGFVPRGGSGVPENDGLIRDHYARYDPVAGYDGHRPSAYLPLAGSRSRSSPSLTGGGAASSTPASPAGSLQDEPRSHVRLKMLEDQCMERALAAAGGKLNSKPSWLRENDRAPVASLPGYIGHQPRFWDMKHGPRAGA
mmetsp:Transcript_2577/g.9939  ORF Transcript_2577/g.9939 Transcript_2577/m.9939 type:complete len:189 (-) Transcript_2577:131-697(-)